MKHLPNTLTIARILVTPLVLYLMFSDSIAGRAWALGLFVAASISDYLDGKLARILHVGSSLGQYLDPFADKILVLGTFIALVFIMPSIVPVWGVVLIAVRDVAVTGLRSWCRYKGRSLKTSHSAKLKTTFQLTFLILILLLRMLELAPGAVGRFVADTLASGWLFWFMVLVVVVTVATGLQYFITVKATSTHDASANH